MHSEHKNGFTLVEILVVVAIIALLSAAAFATFQNLNRKSALRVSVQEVESAFNDARNRTLGAENDTVYGIHIGTDEIVWFSGPLYTAASPTNISYPLQGNVVATSSLTGEATEIVFARLTGDASATGTITLSLTDNSGSTTLTVHQSGLIEE